MWHENWFLALVILVIVGHVLAILFYVVKVLKKETIELDIPEQSNLHAEETAADSTRLQDGKSIN